LFVEGADDLLVIIEVLAANQLRPKPGGAPADEEPEVEQEKGAKNAGAF